MVCDTGIYAIIHFTNLLCRKILITYIVLDIDIVLDIVRHDVCVGNL